MKTQIKWAGRTRMPYMWIRTGDGDEEKRNVALESDTRQRTIRESTSVRTYRATCMNCDC